MKRFISAPPDVPEHDAARVWLALSAAVFAVVVTLVVAVAGYLPMRVALTFSAIVAALLGAGYVAAKCGVDLNRADPNITVAFLVLASLAVSYVAYSADQAPGAIIALYLITFLFGVMTLDSRRLIAVGVFYWLCMAAILALRNWQDPGVLDLRRGAFALVVYFMLLGWLTAMGIYIDSLRAKLVAAGEKTAGVLAELEGMAREDALTGCYNRRYALEILAVEAKRAERGQPLSLCLLDLDHFKDVNDSFGHQAGDEVLAGMARVVKPLLRATDALARYGGEEFLLILSQTPLAEALVVCERVRRAVAGMHPSTLPSALAISVSIGVAEHQLADSMERTLQRADQALYQAKRRGRDCVAAAD